jgi:translation initiation factor IF-3
LNRPFPPRRDFSPASFVRINGKIRAREVRVIGPDGKQLGVMSLNDALNLARQHSVDLVEIASTATPPVCRVVDFGKYRYEQAKKEKESKKHQHATQVKEIQLSPRIDPHDLGVKIQHAVEFLCEDMKVKVALRFRGREMQHTQFGFDVVQKFLKEVEPWGHRDFEPKLIGKGINVMVSPLPRNKRAKNPHEVPGDAGDTDEVEDDETSAKSSLKTSGHETVEIHKPESKTGAEDSEAGFSNNPFSGLNAG